MFLYDEEKFKQQVSLQTNTSESDVDTPGVAPTTRMAGLNSYATVMLIGSS